MVIRKDFFESAYLLRLLVIWNFFSTLLFVAVATRGRRHMKVAFQRKQSQTGLF